MTDKSSSNTNAVPGQRPPLDPDGSTVAIPRPADELNGSDVQDTSKDDAKRKS